MAKLFRLFHEVVFHTWKSELCSSEFKKYRLCFAKHRHGSAPTHTHRFNEQRLPALKVTHLCGVRGALQVTGHEEVDDGSADALSGQDESQRPPEAQHLLDGGVALQEVSGGGGALVSSQSTTERNLTEPEASGAHPHVQPTGVWDVVVDVAVVAQADDAEAHQGAHVEREDGDE